MPTATEESETTAAPADDDTKPAEPDTNDGDDEPSFEQFIERGERIITITFRGRKFQVPRLRGQWPTRSMQIFQRGQITYFPDAVELMFGPAQWDEFNEVAPLISDFYEFMPILAAALGLQRVPASEGE